MVGGAANAMSQLNNKIPAIIHLNSESQLKLHHGITRKCKNYFQNILFSENIRPLHLVL